MHFAATALLLPLVLATPLSQINSAEGSPLAPLHAAGEHIEDAYIVTFKKDVDPSQVALHLSGVEDWHGADVSLITCPFPVTRLGWQPTCRVALIADEPVGQRALIGVSSLYSTHA